MVVSDLTFSCKYVILMATKSDSIDFEKVLKGEKVDGAFGSGKTLNSGPKDNIFVYFADHGAKVVNSYFICIISLN